MDKVTLCVEKPEPYCVFLDFVDMEEFLKFKRLCNVKPIEDNEDCSMLCIPNISTLLKRKMTYADTFQVSAEALANLRWKPSEMGCVRYELDEDAKSFEAILPNRK